MTSQYSTYNNMHADFHSQPSPTYHRSWQNPNFGASKPSLDLHSSLFAPPAHGSEPSSAVSPHYFTQGPPFGHSPHHVNQSIVYPESSQRTLMDDAGPYLPMYDTSSRPTDASARGAVLPARSDSARATGLKFDDSTSRHFATSANVFDHSRYAAMRAPYLNMHHLNTSETSLASHPYRVPAPLSQPSPQDPSPTHHSMAREFTLPLPPASTPISSPASPISPYFNKPDLRPRVLTLQVNSLEPVDDHDHYTALSPFINSRGDISDRKHEQIFSPTIGSLSPMNGTCGQRTPYSHDTTFAEDSSNPARSNSSLGTSSSSTPESDCPPPPYSSLPNGVGAHGRTSIPASAGRTSRKNKMHRCEKCEKLFPRPSGLRTHMNSHDGKKPYKCGVPGCTKAFAVRSNAKRHLRTHGISVLPPASPQTATKFTVGFDAPFISNTYDGGAIPKLKWIQQGPATRTAVDWPDSPSGSDEADGGASPMSAVQSSGHIFGGAQEYVGPPHQYHLSQAGPLTD